MNKKPKILAFDFEKVHIFFIEPYYTFKWCEKSGKVEIKSHSSTKLGKNITIFPNKEGYLRAKINGKTLVLHQFIGEQLFGKKVKGMVINHKDCNKQNNSKNNLEYITISENILHAIKNGRHVSCDITKLPKYIDGRSSGNNKKQYKKDWYEKNKTKKA